MPRSIDKVIWLDGDVIVCKDISTFYKTFDTAGSAVKGIKEIDYENKELAKSLVGEHIPFNYDLLYLNVGILVINPLWFLERWRNPKILDNSLISIDLSKKRKLYPEQDLINIICSGFKDVCIDSTFNFSIDTEVNYYKTKLKNISCIHYTGSKPWIKFDKTVRFQMLYWKNAFLIFPPFYFIFIFAKSVLRLIKAKLKRMLN